MKIIYSIIAETAISRIGENVHHSVKILGHFSSLEKAQECLLKERDAFISKYEPIAEPDSHVFGSIETNHFLVLLVFKDVNENHYFTSSNIKLFSKELED